jgi:hypothetical protein
MGCDTEIVTPRKGIKDIHSIRRLLCVASIAGATNLMQELGVKGAGGQWFTGLDYFVWVLTDYPMQFQQSCLIPTRVRSSAKDRTALVLMTPIVVLGNGVSVSEANEQIIQCVLYARSGPMEVAGGH